MTSNFAFLKDKFPSLAHLGRLAEAYWAGDPNTCLIKLGMLGESMVNLMFQYDNIPFPPAEQNTAARRINVLYYEGLLPYDMRSILHGLRLTRNRAVHQDYTSESDAAELLPLTYSLCEWFMQTYGDAEYRHRPFVMPPKTAAPAVLSEDSSEKEAAMQAAAEKIAAASPSEPRKERQKRAREAANQRQKSEVETRWLIDAQLRQVGWEADTAKLRWSNGTRPVKGRNIAIAEWPTEENGEKGRADYALFAGLRLVGIIEAKAEHKDIPSILDYQGKEYARSIRAEDARYQIGTWGPYKVPFIFATNGRPYLEQYKEKSGIWFLDLRSSTNCPEALQGWMSPSGMLERLEKDVEGSNAALTELPFDFLRDKKGLGLRDYQVSAIEAAEKSIREGSKKVLLAMATGTGKTRTVLGMIYRFLKTGRFRRILFLVDRTALGDQAMDVFREVKLEDLLPLADIYTIQAMDEKDLDKDARIQIATVQGMVRRILYNEGEHMPAVSDYDLIIADEAHRGYFLDREMTETESLYRDQRDYQSKYRAVIDYFDAVKVGLTATPSLQTTEIFGRPVYTYSYRDAVIEGWLADHDAPHEIRTELSEEGIHYRRGETVTYLDPDTGKPLPPEELPDELNFDIDDFNRRVITRSFNETVLREISRDLDPGAPEETGKTLIFAANNAHADLVVSILKEIYAAQGIEEAAIAKITGGIGDRKTVAQAIRKFKNERYPSIVVTVDLLTTGVDVPEITSLVFLRRVRSRILFEQMLGRATRLCPKIHKSLFEIYDAVGVYRSMQDVITMPVVAPVASTFKDLMDGLPLITDEAELENQCGRIIGRLQRKRRSISPEDEERFTDDVGESVADFARHVRSLPPAAQRELLLQHRKALEALDQYHVHRRKGPVISEKKDTLRSHTRNYGETNNAGDYLEKFADYLKTNMNGIPALLTVCTRPGDLTRDSLMELKKKLDRDGYSEARLNDAVASLTNESIAADIISLIRRYAIGMPLMSREDRVRRAVARLRKAHSFTRVEERWIRRMEKYLIHESVLNIDAFDEDGRFREDGGFRRINQAFQNHLTDIVKELNTYLYDDGDKPA